jgi:FkbM family methyltransferase
MKLRYRDGRVAEIQSGPMQGMRIHQFVRTIDARHLRGDKEQALQEALVAELRPGALFFDVGANGGYVSLLGARLVGPGGRVVAYEPHPLTAHEARAQLRLNGFANCEVVVAALAEREGVAAFADDLGSQMLSLAEVRRDAPPSRTISVRVTTLDREAERCGLPDVVKIDTEGSEVQVLRGADRVLRERAPVLLTEVHGPDILVEYQRLLDGYGYVTRPLSAERRRGHHRFFVSRSA